MAFGTRASGRRSTFSYVPRRGGLYAPFCFIAILIAMTDTQRACDQSIALLASGRELRRAAEYLRAQSAMLREQALRKSAIATRARIAGPPQRGGFAMPLRF